MTVPVRFGPNYGQPQPVACLAGDVVGRCMAIRGDRVNGKWRVQTADPRDLEKMPAVGILISKVTPTVGIMQMFGPYEGATGLTPGRRYFVGADGAPASTTPSVAPATYAMVQVIGIAVASDRLLLTGTGDMIRKVFD